MPMKIVETFLVCLIARHPDDAGENEKERLSRLMLNYHEAR